MRLLFAHDHRFHRDPAGELFTTGCLPASIWPRYLEHFDELHVVARSDGIAREGLGLGRTEHENVSFEFFPNLSTFRRLAFRSPELDARMGSVVEEADAVIARLPSEIGLLAAKHARRLGKPYAVEVVGCAWDGALNHGALSARMYAPLSFLRNRRAIAKAPLALYVTSSWLQRRYPTSGHGVGASDVVLLPMSHADAKRREQRLAALAGGERPVLGTIASLRIWSKGIQTALEAISLLRKSGFDFTYKVLGSGPIEPWQRLAKKFGISDLVHFDGTRSAGEGVCGWLEGIDIHLQPSFQEGLPRATVEAMSRGVACIGSTCGGIPELIPPERVHRPGDAAGLADRIRRLATDPGAIAAAVRSDRETARQFDADELAARRSELYGQLRQQAEQRSSALRA